MSLVDSKKYGLSSRVKLEYAGENHLKILLHRKSRIIMKDGQRVLDMVSKIKTYDSAIEVGLSITGPICSKTIQFLNDNEIKVVINELLNV